MNAPVLNIGPSKETVEAFYKGLRELLLVMGDIHACEEVQLAVLKTFRKGCIVKDISFERCNFDMRHGNPTPSISGLGIVNSDEVTTSQKPVRPAPTPTPPPPAHGHGNY